MSLLNDMLRDLDKRTPRTSDKVILDPLNQHSIKTQSNLLGSLLMAILLLPFFIYLVNFKPWHAATIIAPLNPPTKSQETVQPPLVSMIEPIQGPVQKTRASLTPKEWHDEHLKKAFEAIKDGNTARAIDLIALIFTEFSAA